MKSRYLVLGLLIACGALLPRLGAQNQKEKDKDQKEPEKADITVQVREMNSDKFASPPTTFRPGHVKARKLDAKAVTQTESGFAIKLPSKAPIPTPTIYKGKMYVSGGFHSKEYYCFDAATGKLEWAMDLDDDGPTSAVCDYDIIVFNTESCTIFALDAKSGKNLWSYFLGDPLTSTPTIANGKVFTSYPALGGGDAAPGGLNQNPFNNDKQINDKQSQQLPQQQQPQPQQPGKGKAKKGGNPVQPQPGGPMKKRPDVSHVFICLELKTGKILWQRWIDSDVMSAPVAVDDEVYATSFAGTVYKFKQKDGEIVSALRSRATCAPVVVGNSVYWTQRADKGRGEKVAEEIAGNDRNNGTQNFAANKREAVYLDNIAQEKTTFNKVGQKLDAQNGFAGGAPAAANPNAALMNIGQGNVSTMQSFQGSRILHFNNANYNCMGDELINTDPKDGKVRWSVKVKGDLAKQGGHLAAPPAAAGGQLFLATVEGEVLQVDPDKGNVTKTYKVGSPIRSQPAIEGGRIYVGTQDGRVVCINTGDARFTGWSTWGANMAHTNIVEAPAAKK